MRRVRPDPIPQDVQAKILDAAIRAPSGGNTQNWRFMLIDDPQLRAKLAPLYKDSIDTLWQTLYKERIAAAQAAPDSAEGAATLTMQRSAQWLADNFEVVPLWLFAFVQNDGSGGSIYPAVWSAQLAARAEGVGSALTSAMCNFHGDEAKEILGVPQDEGWIFTCCLSFGHPPGRGGLAKRRPVPPVSYTNGWGRPLGYENNDPLWSGSDA
jgi:nitroreductase